MATPILVSAMTPITAVNATYSYAIGAAGVYGKIAINAADGLPIYNGTALVPLGDHTNNLGSDATRWKNLYLSQVGPSGIIWSNGAGDGSEISYNGTGPSFFDVTTQHTLQFDVQSLSTDRTATWPNASGTVTLLGNTSTGSGSVVLATAPTLSNPVVGTQSNADNSTKAASTAYVDGLGTLLGDTLYWSASGTRARLAGNTSATLAVLTQTGNGSVSAAPVWTASTGTGNNVMSTSPTVATPTLTGAVTRSSTPSDVVSASASDPAAPGASTLTYYTKKLAGRETPWVRGPSGVVRSIEFPEATCYKSGWTATGGAAGLVFGVANSQAGTAAAPSPAVTNKYTMMPKSTFASVVTTTNQQVGMRGGSNPYFRGNAAGIGGFLFICRFGFTSIKTGCRAFIGLTAAGGSTVTSDPSSTVNCLGFGFDLADSAWTFMHNDASGTATKDAIAGQTTLATNNTGFIAYIFCYPNDSVVYYRLDDLQQGTTLCDTSTNTDLPVNTTALAYSVVMSNGTANTTAGDATIGCCDITVWTEF